MHLSQRILSAFLLFHSHLTIISFMITRRCSSYIKTHISHGSTARFAHSAQFPHFRTTISSFPKNFPQISPHSKLFFLGSCFSEHISSILWEKYLLDVTSNPQGILFNPLSLCRCLEEIIAGTALQDEDFIQDEQSGLWYHWDCHSDLVGQSKDAVKRTIKEQRTIGQQTLKDANIVFITFGTAKVYSLKSSGRVVANCHKQSNALFTSRFLGVEEIVEQCTRSLDLLLTLNPSVKVMRPFPIPVKLSLTRSICRCRWCSPCPPCVTPEKESSRTHGLKQLYCVPCTRLSIRCPAPFISLPLRS